jgi:hypothetical protein
MASQSNEHKNGNNDDRHEQIVLIGGNHTALLYGSVAVQFNDNIASLGHGAKLPLS